MVVHAWKRRQSLSSWLHRNSICVSGSSRCDFLDVDCLSVLLSNVIAIAWLCRRAGALLSEQQYHFPVCTLPTETTNHMHA